MTSISSLAGDMSQLHQQLFTQADKNSDKSLSLDEFSKLSTRSLSDAGVITAQQPGTNTSLQAIFKRLDSDGDGKLTKTELEAGAKLTSQIQDILLKIQEMQGGGLFSSLMSGSSKSSSSNNLFSTLTSGIGTGGDSSFSSLFGSSDNSSSDSFSAGISSLIQQVMANYEKTTTANQASTSGGTTTTA